jgi:ubiquinone biosynthesis protein
LAPFSTLTPRRSGRRALSRGRGDSDPDPADGWMARLCRRLTASGPIAARFGIYLGSRVDLFSGTDCLRLLEIPDRAAGSPPELVAELVNRELGAPPQELFAVFDPEPFDSGLVFQWHGARLPDGEDVTVQLIHPELEADLESGRLRRLTERLIAEGELPAGAGAAVEEFEARLDLRRAAAALERLAEETDGMRRVVVPRVHLRLCSPLARVASTVRGSLAVSADGDGAGRSAREARVRHLVRIWLAMVLRGGRFPVEPWGRNVRYLEGGRVAFLGGQIHRLPRSSRGELREYLVAVAAQEPARAAAAFLDLLPEGPGDRQLSFRIRHTDPFRDRGWDVGGDLFARQVLAQWRTAEQLGYRLPEGLAPFYRGLFLINQEARRLAAEAPSVRDGFREARLLLLFGELREELEPGRWADIIERQLSVAIGLPQRLDRILTLAAGPEDGASNESRRSVEQEPHRQGAGAAVAACLLALTSVVLLAHHLVEAGTFAPWPERLGAGLVLLLGGLLLRVSTRSGGG